MPFLRLNEKSARDVLLVRAIESEDARAALLTREDRHYATSAALSATGLREKSGPRQVAAFLSRRAELALDRLIARYPMLERARMLTRWPRWLNWLLPLAALAIGLATNAVDRGQLNILAFPLLGMLIWNLAVYVWLLLGSLRRLVGGPAEPARHPLGGLTGLLLRPASAHLAGHPTLERAVARYGREWAKLVAPLTRARASRTLHLSAAMFAIGIVGGMFARARYTAEYSAGWAGTWAGAEAEIAVVLGVVLAPASALTGIALPTIERLRELRGATENAGDWLILWMVTAALFVVIPRLLLALVEAIRSSALQRRLRIEQDFYVRSMLRDALGRPRTVRVVPYSINPSAEAHETLRHILVQVFGEKTEVQIDPPLSYGEEDGWLSQDRERASAADQLVLLFNLASTPESENHGALVEGVRQQLGRQAELMVLLDDSGFVHKLRGQPSAPRRIDERLQTWKAVLAHSETDPIRVTLETEFSPDAARDLEEAMLRAGPRR